MFGIEPDLLARIWNRVGYIIVSEGYSLRDFLATFHFMKCYCSSLAQVAPVFRCHEDAVLQRVEYIATRIDATIRDDKVLVRTFGVLLGISGSAVVSVYHNSYLLIS